MRATILGGAAACPNPGQGCSSYLVTSEDDRLLLDCGPDTLSTLRTQTDFRSISAVLISHIHSDHTLDLVAYRYGLKYGPGASGRRIPLWMPPGGSEFLSRLGSVFALGGEASMAFFDEVFDVAEYDPAQPLTLGRMTVTFQETDHAIPCWAMRIEADGRTLVYTADTIANADIERFARGADVLLAEATMPAGSDMGEHPVHMTASQAGQLARDAGAGSLVITHYWAELDPERLRGQAAEQFGGNVLLARPGLTVDV